LILCACPLFARRALFCQHIAYKSVLFSSGFLRAGGKISVDKTKER
jgi:hypothetical protein